MKVILDTNVVVSGVFFGGVPGRIMTAWSTGRISLVLSPAILTEYQRVGAELGIQYPELNAVWEPILALVAMHATIVDAPVLPERVGEDPADEIFWAAALASRTSIIVSGDKHLLRVSSWHGISVRTPRQFHDEHLGAG